MGSFLLPGPCPPLLFVTARKWPSRSAHSGRGKREGWGKRLPGGRRSQRKPSLWACQGPSPASVGRMGASSSVRTVGRGRTRAESKLSCPLAAEKMGGGGMGVCPSHHRPWALVTDHTLVFLDSPLPSPSNGGSLRVGFALLLLWGLQLLAWGLPCLEASLVPGIRNRGSDGTHLSRAGSGSLHRGLQLPWVPSPGSCRPPWTHSTVTPGHVE